MSMEEGEISDGAPSSHSILHEPSYDPSYEWPGSGTPDDPHITPAPQPSTSATAPPTCRLLLAQSTILPAHQRLAILEAYPDGVQLGRDLPADTSTPRVRLKEMAVSKLHATVFWDAERATWAVVDMGSMHGTFVRSDSESGGAGLRRGGKGNAADAADSVGVRLSAPRVASVPRALRHMDCLMLGGTAFVVHIHESRLPCVECSASAGAAGDEIPLFAQRKRKREVDAEPAGYVAPAEKNAKKALTSLKHEMLRRDGYSESVRSSSLPRGQGYVDRSARRRALHPSSAPDTPGIATPPAFPPAAASARTTALPYPIPASALAHPEPVRSAPPAPLEASNIGHRLLRMQGWEPGSALGLPDDDGEEGIVGYKRLVEPLEVNASVGRAGLGMPVRSPDAPRPVVNDWTRRRWEDIRRAS
ncbi:hypothetical protein FA95DRAFT_801925 [Auriscalpium vulgare]|uniref:Uncharacterized protein n=1 Tax=Auriscalpium vulgare TaxID=40419 RepID=A0ACB8S0Y4_9AGAM|nr:hypothetical protein FA95DRAFT_801925 [Auriscalpium vulgare]